MIVWTKGGLVPKKILTKARLVTINYEETNYSKQMVLHQLYLQPDLCETVYLDHNKIMVKLVDQTEPYNIGILHEKYKDYYEDGNFVLKVKSWEITGGWDMPKLNGQTITKKAYYGLNLDIDVKKRTNY